MWGDAPGVRCASSGLPVPGEQFKVVRFSQFTHQIESHPVLSTGPFLQLTIELIFAGESTVNSIRQTACSTRHCAR